jgi:acyl-CoA synthetase (AMP-forming)/AMP-acid ligase II
VLLEWLQAPNECGVNVAEGENGWVRYGYRDLAVEVRRFAAGLIATGAPRGAVVSLLTDEPKRFIVAFMGTLAAGMAPSPLAPPRSLRGTDRYLAHLAGVFAVAAPSIVVADEEMRGHAEAALGAAGHRALILPPDPDPAIEPLDAPIECDAGMLALLQFTSGSSGAPKGVRVTWRNLTANTRAMRDWLGWRTDDVVATWLPLHHDMGLLGGMITPIISGSELWIMTPVQFIRSPQRWLDCFGRHGATLTTAPSFGYAYCARRVGPEQLAGSDYSRWRVAVLGAERIDPVALYDFCRLVRPFGFGERALTGAYGLAESTLAVTGTAPGAGSPLLRPAAANGEFGTPVGCAGRGVLGADRADANWLAGCGAPLLGQAVRILDEDGRPVPDGVFGEIAVSGPSVAEGYLEAGGVITPFAADGLRTGDGGFVQDGQLYVVGRVADSLKVRGAMLFAEDLEARLAQPEVLARRPAAVLLGRFDGRDHAVLLVEDGSSEAWLDSAVSTLRAFAGAEMNIVVFHGKRGAIDRTSSGKPRRRVLWRRLTADSPDAWPWQLAYGVSPGRRPAPGTEQDTETVAMEGTVAETAGAAPVLAAAGGDAL